MHNNTDWICTQINATTTRCYHAAVNAAQPDAEAAVPGFGVIVLLPAIVLAALIWARKRK